MENFNPWIEKNEWYSVWNEWYNELIYGRATAQYQGEIYLKTNTRLIKKFPLHMCTRITNPQEIKKLNESIGIYESHQH
jgi:hypothetical protein